MSTRLKQRSARAALWSHRIVRFMIPVIIIGALAHRLGMVDTPTAMTILGIGWAGCLGAALLGVAGIYAIWRHGIEGLRQSFVGIFLSLPVLALPGYFVWLLFTQPQLHDITTDTLTPPGFDEVVRLRAPGANSVSYPGLDHASVQVSVFPEIRPFRTGLSSEDAYGAALTVAVDSGWRIIFRAPPPDGDSPGRIEAVASTLLMGFKDDVVIRVTPDQGGSRIDIRSASRYGKHDFGANAKRVRNFLFALREALAPTSGGER